MIDSTIASLHHYYVVFVKGENIRSLQTLVSLFPKDSRQESIKVPGRRSFIHIQCEIKRRYGSQAILELNKSKIEDNSQYYWYDFYVGAVEDGQDKVFYICYPYLKLGGYIDKMLKNSTLKMLIFKPVLSLVLKYMKDNKGSVVKGTILAEIIKYGAQINDEGTIISISGRNPLQSSVYRELEGIKKLNIEPVKLKLKCTNTAVGDIEVSFDRLGNYRYWIGAYNESSTTAMLPDVFNFFKAAKALNEETYINQFSMLENNGE